VKSTVHAYSERLSLKDLDYGTRSLSGSPGISMEVEVPDWAAGDWAEGGVADGEFSRLAEPPRAMPDGLLPRPKAAFVLV
jgi:hypothetical protein